jgi:hypothetical protein
LPLKGDVFISVKDSDKPAALEVARELVEFGPQRSTPPPGTAAHSAKNGLKVPLTLKNP